MMRAVNILVSILLGAATAALAAVFWLGSKEDHAQLLAARFWTAFGGRFFLCALVGLFGGFVWWLLNAVFIRGGPAKKAQLIRAAWVLAMGPICGAFLGALLFCSK